MRRWVILLSVSLLSMLSVAAHAGHPHERNGFFLGFGFGFGVAGWDFADPDVYGGSASEWSGAFNVRLGGALKPNLLLGAELAGWARFWRIETSAGDHLGDLDVKFGSVNLAATYFPGNVGAFLRGGVGFANGQPGLTLPDGTGVEPEADTGISVLVGGGYEWRLTPTFAMSPEVQASWLGIDGAVFGNATVVAFLVDFDWYW